MRRMLPSNTDYEKSVLAYLLDPTLKGDDKAEVFDALRPTDFYDERNGAIFTACHALYKTKKPVDLVTVTEATDGAFVGNGAYIATIIDRLPATNLDHYTDVLRNYAKVREAIKILHRRIEDLQSLPNTDGVAELMDAIQADILGIDARGKANFMGSADLVGHSLDQFRAMNRGDDFTTITTGYRDLDDVVSIKGPKLVIIAARPSVGKSAFAGCILRHLGKIGVEAAIFEMEMDRHDIMNRWISMETGIPLTRLTFGSGPHQQDWPKIIQAGERIYRWPILIDDDGGLTIAEVRRRARLAAKRGCKAIFIDQLSQMRGPGKTEYDKNTNILQELSRLKKELKIPVFLLCQIGRRQFENKDNRPRLHHLKTTGAIEEEADVVLLMDRPYLYTDDEADKERAIVDVAKQRGGAIGAIEFEWRGVTTEFRNKCGL